MLFVDGNMKLLDSENSNDLCQMILNNLTRIKNKPAHVEENSIEGEDEDENANNEN